MIKMVIIEKAVLNFMAVLNEGTYFKQLAVGPFYNYESAEKSKFVYLKKALGFSDESDDSLKSRDSRSPIPSPASLAPSKSFSR